MRELHEYKGQMIVETDEGPFGQPVGSWILSKSPAGWRICHVYDPGVIHECGPVEPLGTREDAWVAVCREVDVLLLERASMDKAEDFEPRVLHYAVQQGVARGEFSRTLPASGVKVQMSLDLLIRLHNALSAGDALRADLRTQLSAQVREHAGVAGVMLDDAGDLHFDLHRAAAASQRRAVERYVSSVQSSLDDLAHALKSVLGSAAEETGCVAKSTVPGRPLADFDQVSAAARALTSLDAGLLEVLGGVAKRARAPDALPAGGSPGGNATEQGGGEAPA